MNSSQNQSLSFIRLYLFRAHPTTRRGNMPFAATSRSACDLSLAAFDGVSCMIRRTSVPFPAQSREYYVEAAEAARFLSIHPRTLQQLARAGIVPAHPLGSGPPPFLALPALRTRRLATRSHRLILRCRPCHCQRKEVSMTRFQNGSLKRAMRKQGES